MCFSTGAFFNSSRRPINVVFFLRLSKATKKHITNIWVIYINKRYLFLWIPILPDCYCSILMKLLPFPANISLYGYNSYYYYYYSYYYYYILSNYYYYYYYTYLFKYYCVPIAYCYCYYYCYWYYIYKGNPPYCEFIIEMCVCVINKKERKKRKLNNQPN